MIRVPVTVSVMLLAIASPLGLSSQAEDARPSGKLRVYLGTYTSGDSRGIYVCELDLADGSLSEPRLAGEAKNPSFLALHPGGKHLYAVSESKAPESSSGSPWTPRRVAFES